MKKVNFSIIVVNCNGKPYLEKCLKSIIESDSRDYEIIIVDNGSSDNSKRHIREKFRDFSDLIKIISLDRNYGPAKARNEGVKIARGDFICFLDNDTEVEKSWSKEALSMFQDNPKLAVLQCKLILGKERKKIDYVGELLGQNGFLVQVAKTGEVDRGQYDKNIKILAAKSAGMFIRKSVFEEVGGFDEDYFIYVEETDLGWRCLLSGYENKLAYKSVVHHQFGTSTAIFGKGITSYNSKFHGSKNYIQTLLKNLEKKNLLFIFIPHVSLWIMLAFYYLVIFRTGESIWIFKGIFWNIINFLPIMKKRKFVQEKRIKSDKEIFKEVMRKKPISYFIGKAVNRQRVGNAESF